MSALVAQAPHPRPAQGFRRQARAGRHRPRRCRRHLDGGDRRLRLGQVGAAQMHPRPDRAGRRRDRDRRPRRSAHWTAASARRCAPASACCSRTARCSTVCRSGRTSPSACSPGATCAAPTARAAGGSDVWRRSVWRRRSAICGRRNCRAACRSASPSRARSPRSPNPVLRRTDHRARSRSWAP